MAELKGVILENVRYDFQDTQARETADSALKQAEENTNDITALENNISSTTTTAQTALTTAQTAQTTAESAQTTADEAKSIATEKSSFGGEIALCSLASSETKTIQNGELEKILGFQLLAENKGLIRWTQVYIKVGGDPRDISFLRMEVNELGELIQDSINRDYVSITQKGKSITIENKASDNLVAIFTPTTITRA